MPGILANFLLAIAGFITGWFVSRESLNFEFFQIAIATLIFTGFFFLIAYFPRIKRWYQRRKKT